MLAPAILILLLFFFAPLWYVFAYSTGCARSRATKVLAELERRADVVQLRHLERLPRQGRRSSTSLGAKLSMPFWVMAVILTVAADRRRRRRQGAALGRLDRRHLAASLLLLPFTTLPAGSNLLRRRASSSPSDSSYLRLFFKSVTLAMTTSVFAVLIAFPIAYYLAFCADQSKYTWLLIVIAPFFTSYLLRIFAWKVILGDAGLDQLRPLLARRCSTTASRSRSCSTASSR